MILRKVPVQVKHYEYIDTITDIEDIMLLPKLNPRNMCNGMRLLIKDLRNNIIEAIILTGPAAGQLAHIPRNTTIPTDLPLPFKRLQFPGCFSNGKLYVWVSRVGNPENQFIWLPENNKTINIVYREDIHGDSSSFLLRPSLELSNGFWPRLTSPHRAIQFVPKMFYRVEVGALGGSVQSANIVVGVPLHSSPCHMAPDIVVLEVTRVHFVKTPQCWEYFFIQNITIGLCVHATTDKHQRSYAEGLSGSKSTKMDAEILDIEKPTSYKEDITKTELHTYSPYLLGQYLRIVIRGWNPSAKDDDVPPANHYTSMEQTKLQSSTEEVIAFSRNQDVKHLHAPDCAVTSSLHSIRESVVSHDRHFTWTYSMIWRPFAARNTVRERAQLNSAKEALEFTCSGYWDMVMAMAASVGQVPCMLHASNVRKRRGKREIPKKIRERPHRKLNPIRSVRATSISRIELAASQAGQSSMHSRHYRLLIGCCDEVRPLYRTAKPSLTLLLPAYYWLTVVYKELSSNRNSGNCLESTSPPNEFAKYSWLYKHCVNYTRIQRYAGDTARLARRSDETLDE
ncbi:hypothetical protein PR048_002266 [Dryococelus australis]|uniref:DNA helicase n=1 Tax=Dryococelus australis TaxID=614101 RepID=A0ABQ9IL86_9NEOP|nr:hypothetical protein PR048_002266 [Dryococelus australis]